MKKKISVVLCTYNGERFIKEQLDSILNQTYPIYELIIQDDCSTDSTWDILQTYQNEFQIIKCYRNKVNLKAHDNFITAFKRATGDYISPSDQDDIWMKNKLETLIENIRDKDLAFSHEKIIFEDGSIKDLVVEMNPIEKLVWGNNLNGHTFLFKQSVLKIFDTTENIAFDYRIAMYACVKNSFICYPKCLSIWRRHEDVCTSAMLLKPTLQIENISGWSKMNFTIKSLSKGKKNYAIKNSLQARSTFIKCLDNNDTKIKTLSYMLHNVSKQTVSSFLLAGISNVYLLKYDKSFATLSLKTKLAKISFQFRTPFMYWYDMHNEKALE